jgi:riboflavin synthase alpha subunit
MTNEQLRMQMLSGIITEGEYKTKLEELNAAESKDSLNEHYVAGGIVGIGAITQIPSREKTDYEMAFEHFLGERYLTNFENREQDPYKMEEGEEEEDLDEGKEVEEPENY